MPSSNHLIETSPLKLVFLILVGGLIQAMRLASLAQYRLGIGCGLLIAPRDSRPELT